MLRARLRLFEARIFPDAGEDIKAGVSRSSADPHGGMTVDNCPALPHYVTADRG
jgi:hypothetical protein